MYYYCIDPGAALIGQRDNGSQLPQMHESLNFYHLMNYICSGCLRYDGDTLKKFSTANLRNVKREDKKYSAVLKESNVGTKKWYTTAEDKVGRFDCRECDNDGCPIKPTIESFNGWIIRMITTLQNLYLNPMSQ